MTDYGEFLDGLKTGLHALWQPDFMTGVRNGGFEQTLRNVCVPFIEKATGRMAFTEANERADVVLRSLEARDAASTRCEFKTNFSAQTADIRDRSKEAIDQARPLSFGPRDDGVVVYAITELVIANSSENGLAARHNAFVKSPKYKLFKRQAVSDAAMAKALAELRSSDTTSAKYMPVHTGLDDLWLSDRSGFARLHVWTYYIPPTKLR